MLDKTQACIKNYFHSSYQCDQQEYGSWSVKGRLVSFIDIPAQIARATLLTSGFVAVGLFKIGAAGLRITFKIIPQAFMSIIPKTDKAYWKNHVATNWDLAKYSLTRAPHHFSAAFRLAGLHTYWIAIDLLGCTLKPNVARELRVDTVDWCNKQERIIKKNNFYYSNGIRSRNDPLPVNIQSLHLSAHLQTPMQDIISVLNEEIRDDNGNNPLVKYRHHKFSINDPKTETEQRQWKLTQYLRQLEPNSTKTLKNYALEDSIAFICLDKLVEAGVIYEYGLYSNSDSHIWVEA